MTIEIVDFPIHHGGSFHSFLYVYQRVAVMASWDAWDVRNWRWPSQRVPLLAKTLRSRCPWCPGHGRPRLVLGVPVRLRGEPFVSKQKSDRFWIFVGRKMGFLASIFCGFFMIFRSCGCFKWKTWRLHKSPNKKSLWQAAVSKGTVIISVNWWARLGWLLLVDSQKKYNIHNRHCMYTYIIYIHICIVYIYIYCKSKYTV